MGILFDSIIVYTITALLLYFSASSVVHTKDGTISIAKKSKLPRGFLWCIIIFIIFAGVRYDVGVDHLEYLDNYLRALKGLDFNRSTSSGFEEGYVFLTRAFASLSIHPTIYFGFLAALQITFVVLAIKDEKRIVPYVMLLIILGGYFFTWMNGIRQMIAACTYFWGTRFINEKKISSFIICGIFAYLWHHSSIIFFPCFLFAFSHLVWNKTWINLSLFITCVVVGLTPTWVDLLNRFTPALAMLGYDNYSDMMGQLLDPTNGTSFNVGPRYLFAVFSYVLVIFYYPKARKFFNSPIFDLYFKFFLIGCCLYYLLVNVGMIFLRPVLYFSIFSLPVTAYILVYLQKTKNYLLFVLLLMFTMTYTYISCMSDAGLPEAERRSYLYHFYFSNVNKVKLIDF